MNLKVENEITRLTKDWYEYVNLNHHKDRDCHWYLIQTYSYGNEPIWTVQHFGYVFDFGEIHCGNSFEKAQRCLLETIRKAFAREVEWAKEMVEPDEDHLPQIKWLKERGYLKEAGK